MASLLIDLKNEFYGYHFYQQSVNVFSLFCFEIG